MSNEENKSESNSIIDTISEKKEFNDYDQVKITKPLGVKAKKDLVKGEKIPYNCFPYMNDSIIIDLTSPIFDPNLSTEERKKHWEEYKEKSQNNSCISWERSHFDHSELTLLKNITQDQELYRHFGTEFLAIAWIDDVIAQMEPKLESHFVSKALECLSPKCELILSLLNAEEAIKILEEATGILISALCSKIPKVYSEHAVKSWAKYQYSSQVLQGIFKDLTPEEMTNLVNKRKPQTNSK
jgi:hypothetical protein